MSESIPVTLKNCPFCGHDLNNQEAEDTIYPVGRSNVLELVCQEYAGGCGATVVGYTIDECINKWNRRT